MHLYNIEIIKSISSTHAHSKETADCYLDVLKRQNLCDVNLENQEDNRLNPESFWHDKKIHVELLNSIKDIKQKNEGTNKKSGILITGHQPQLFWLLKSILKKTKTLPLGQSEVICIQINPRKQLLWSISDNNLSLTNEIKEKIKSKIDITKYFTGFLTIFFGFVLSNIQTIINYRFIDTKNVSGLLGLFFIILSIILCILTMFAYDRLIMPSIFWSGNPFQLNKKNPKWIPRRPPTQINWILYFNMVRIWKWIFIPSVISFFIGTLVH